MNDEEKGPSSPSSQDSYCVTWDFCKPDLFHNSIFLLVNLRLYITFCCERILVRIIKLSDPVRIFLGVKPKVGVKVIF